MKPSKYVNLFIAGVLTSTSVAAPAFNPGGASNSPTSRNPAQEQNIEFQKIQIASQLAENLFFLEQQAAILKTAKNDLENFRPNRVGDYTLAAAVAFAAGSVWMFRQAKHSISAPALLYLLGGIVGSAATLYTTALGIWGKIESSKNDKKEKEKLLAAIDEATKIIEQLKAQTDAKLAVFGGNDPQLKEKIKQNISKENFRLERISSLNTELIAAKDELKDLKDSFENWAYFTAYSSAQLLWDSYKMYQSTNPNPKAAKMAKAWLVIDAAAVTGLGYMTYSKHKDAKQKEAEIDSMLKSLKEIEQDYKAAIIERLTRQ